MSEVKKSAALKKGTKKGMLKNSLVLKISAAYVVLTIINLIFFSIIIIENQTSLLLTNFKYEADSLAKNTLLSLVGLKIEQSINVSAYKSLHENLASYDLSWYKVFSTKKQGRMWYQHFPQISEQQQKEAKAAKVSKEMLKKVQQLNSYAGTSQARYLLELRSGKCWNRIISGPNIITPHEFENVDCFDKSVLFFLVQYFVQLQKKNFNIEILLPIGKNKGIFLEASLNLKSMQDRIDKVYYQVAGAVMWGVIFHVLFALFLMRVIFRRVSLLVDASKKMGQGDYSARVKWKINSAKKDELDVLGASFNSMAWNVQEKVEAFRNQVGTINILLNQIDKELKVGKEIQNILLSASKGILDDFKPQVYFRPLREVSGDMLHYFKLSENRRGVFFADASGHGTPAALLTAVSFLSLEDALRRTKSTKDTMELMNVLNKAITKRLQQAFYLTAVILIFDNDGQLWTTNAGHNAFFILPKGKEKITVKADGLPVGVLPDSKYPMHRYPVKSGDKIFIYSDGLTETVNDQKEEFGLERLEAILHKNDSSSIEDTAKEVKDAFDSFASNFTDDVSFLGLEVP